MSEENKLPESVSKRFNEKFGEWFEGAEIDAGYPKSVSIELKSFLADELAREWDLIAKELNRRSLKIYEMVSDERGLHLIVNPDEIEEGTATLFAGDVLKWIYDLSLISKAPEKNREE